VLSAISLQAGVEISLHLHCGIPLPSDFNRWFTIARAREEAKRYGNSAWVMFVDDDVVLGENCIATLVEHLRRNPQLAATAADYDHDLRRPERVGHIGMGATLFRRAVVGQFTFRATKSLCECWCACLDLRRMNAGIEYCRHARASHHRQTRPSRVEPLKPAAPAAAVSVDSNAIKPESVLEATIEPRILAAFDRRDVQRFELQFLKTLRQHGNHQHVTAYAYGLYPSERSRLSRLERVELRHKPFNGVMPPIRRVDDFAEAISEWNPATPVAYWDVADVWFQDSLDELWLCVRNHPRLLHAVAEPKGYPHNAVIPAWSLSIIDASQRRKAFELLRANPFLNSGFAAGTAKTMLRYFREAGEYRRSPRLRGTTDWGDQMGLNLYCHRDPSRWRSIDPRWNYCVHDRPFGAVQIRHGRVIDTRGHQVSVVHGNARSLRQMALLPGT
jgi:hypothetical protein